VRALSCRSVALACLALAAWPQWSAAGRLQIETRGGYGFHFAASPGNLNGPVLTVVGTRPVWGRLSVLASLSHLPTPQTEYPVACPAVVGYDCGPLVAESRMTSLSLGIRYPIGRAYGNRVLAYVEAGPAVCFGRWRIGHSSWSESTIGVQANLVVPVVVRDSFSLDAGWGWIYSKEVRLPNDGYDEKVSFRYVHVFGGLAFDL
jgi:hypothetical protein